MPKGKYIRPIRRSIIIPIGPSIAYIELTKSQFSLIDREDAAWAGEYNWCAQWHICTSGFYAVRSMKLPSGKQKKIGLHTAVMNPQLGFVADHISGNTLDNRSCNLRQATQAQNISNSKTSINNTSGFKGVSWDKNSRKWRSVIRINGKRVHLGLFEDKSKAQESYKLEATKYYGEFFRAA